MKIVETGRTKKKIHFICLFRFKAKENILYAKRKRFQAQNSKKKQGQVQLRAALATLPKKEARTAVQLRAALATLPKKVLTFN